MRDRVLFGVSRFMIPLPPLLWRHAFRRTAGDASRGVRFMSAEHHAVRDYVVRELPRRASPLSADHIASQLRLPVERIDALLAELEKRLLFLYRTDGAHVTWAYPVTVETTPHEVTFSTGERLFAA